MAASVKSMAIATLALLLAGAAHAQPGPMPPPEVAHQPLLIALPTLPVHELAAHLRTAALKGLPKELIFETSDNWGRQAQIPSIQGVRLIHVPRNHGSWEKARVVARDVPEHLRLHVGKLYSAADNRAVFTVHIALPAHVELQKEIWQNGIQIYAGKVRSALSAIGGCHHGSRHERADSGRSGAAARGLLADHPRDLFLQEPPPMRRDASECVEMSPAPTCRTTCAGAPSVPVIGSACGSVFGVSAGRNFGSI